MIKTIKFLLSFFLLASFSALSQKKDNLSLLLQQVSKASLKKNLFFLAGDSCQGRMTATHGDSVATRYVENWYKQYKLLPVAHGSYRQQVSFIDNTSFIESLSIDGITKNRFEDWDYQWPLDIFTKGIDIREAPLVFINHGITLKKYNDFDNLDVKGKVVVHLTGVPTYVKDSLMDPEEVNGKIKDYENMGALAAVLLPTNFDYESIAAEQKKANAFKLYTLKNDTTSMWAKMGGFPYIYVSKSFFNSLLGDKAAVKDSLLNNTHYLKNDPQAFDLNKKISIHIKRKTSEVVSPNIIGMIKGTDTTAGYILFTAHRDHEGKAFDSTWYGADDNGSGTVAMMECQKAIANLYAKGIKPKRTILFISTTAEEHGLLGAKYFTQNPLVPLKKIKYVINIDMLGRIDSKHTDNKRTDSNYVYPLYFDTLFNFKNVLDEANRSTKLVIDDYYLKNKYEESMIDRSDHAVFNEIGIPAIWFFTGIHKDYHQPTDTPDKINYKLLAQRTKLVLGVIWKLANE